MLVHLLDGTYELFRQFYGQRRYNEGKDKPFGAVAGMLHSVLEMIEKGATHLGVATDHVIESFRNELWPASGGSACRDGRRGLAHDRAGSRRRAGVGGVPRLTG